MSEAFQPNLDFAAVAEVAVVGTLSIRVVLPDDPT